MKNKFLILLSIILFSIISYYSYGVILDTFQKLQMRFSEIHSLLSGDDPDAMFDEQNSEVNEDKLKEREKLANNSNLSSNIVPWKILSEAKLSFRHKNNQQIAVAEHTEPLQLLNHKIITVKGFIFPIETAGKQKHFLLSKNPPSCPYCLPAGPSELIDVWMDRPIDFTYETVTIKGEFELLEKDEDIKTGMFYRMKDAVFSE